MRKPHSEEVLLELKDICLSLDSRRVLNNFNLEVRLGEIHALLGANGAGKSSLAYLIMGCEGYAPSSGRILFDGQLINDHPMYKRAHLGITLAWQEPARFEGLSVEQYLTVGRPMRGAAASLQRVGLPAGDILSRPVDRHLSGGERKRIELASVFVMQPKLAILDEPAAGIDMLSLDEIQRVFTAMRDSGSAVLLITHRDDMVAGADRASQICGGRVVCQGEPRVVVANYKARRCDFCDGETCGFD